MTILICKHKDHEDNTGTHVCAHIQNAIIGNQSADLKLIKIDFTYQGEKEFEGYLCGSCATSINIEKDAILELGETKAEKAFGLSVKLVCAYCFRDAFENA